MDHVETYPAGEFICDQCGKNNFFYLIRYEQTPYTEEELEELEDTFGDDVEEMCMNEHLAPPELVICQHCKSRFEVCNAPEGECTNEHELPTVETFCAGWFQCQKCGVSNTFSLISVDEELSEEDVAALIDEQDIPPGHDVHPVLLPAVVTCNNCDTQYDTSDPEPEDEDDGVNISDTDK